MADTTARLALPLLQAGQAQKELFHNEALALLDMVTLPVVQTIGDSAPPGTPAIGACWIVGTAPSGDWTGQAGAIAGWTGGGWRFVTPREGMAVWSLADDLPARHDGTEWVVGEARAARVLVGGVQVVGARCDAIANPAGGSTIDSEGRDAIASIIAALRTHGLIATA